MHLKLMYVANDAQVVKIAQDAGVDRIWIDMEVDGKEERQKNMNTLKSHHTVEDIKKVRPLLNTSELLVRVNPWCDKTKWEIEKCIEYGADIIMLPMWKTVKEVKEFLAIVNGRVKTMLLLETKEACNCLDEVLILDGIDEIHIGLNDLHLSYGMTFMFEPLVNGMVEKICNKIKERNIPYGFGGITKLGNGLLPAEKIIMEHYRMGSTMAILSRSFCIPEEYEDIEVLHQEFDSNMEKLLEYESQSDLFTEEKMKLNMSDLKECVDEIVTLRKGLMK